MSSPDLRESFRSFLEKSRRGFFSRLFNSKAGREALVAWNEQLLEVVERQQETLGAFNATLLEHERRTVEQSAQIARLQEGLASWDEIRPSLRILGAQVGALTAHATAVQSEISRLSGLANQATAALDSHRERMRKADQELRTLIAANRTAIETQAARHAGEFAASLRELAAGLARQSEELKISGAAMNDELARHGAEHTKLAEALRETIDTNRGQFYRAEATVSQMASQLGRLDANAIMEFAQARHERSRIEEELVRQQHEHNRLAREVKDASEFSRTLAAHADASLVRIKDELGKVAAARQTISTLNDMVAQHIAPRIEETRGKMLEMDADLQRQSARLAKLYRERGPDDPELFDRFYLAFENQFRGTPKEVAAKTLPYLPAIKKVITPKGPKGWVDLGCGRGEWLEQLAALGLEPVGVDNNSSMLKVCQERGLKVIDADALEYVQKLPSDSLLGISGFHIIEHLPYRTLLALMSAMWRAIKPGGCLILETPNPQNVSVGACNFYMDLTHQKPIPPMTAEFLVRHAGFREVKVLRLSPYERYAQRDSLPTVTDREYCEMFYGPRDYGIVAYK